MTATLKPRILIEDLSPLEELSDEEMARIFGAGPNRNARLGVEALETRDLMAAALVTPLPASNGIGAPTPVIAHETSMFPQAEVLAGASNVLNQKVVAFDVTTTGALTFNFDTGNYSASIKLPAGVTLDTNALKTLMNGQLAAPKVEPIQAITAFAGLKTSVSSDYDAIWASFAKAYGGGNVYLSTTRFTDWASPENAAGTIGTAVVTGGATTGQAIQEAKNIIIGELGNIYTWLKHKAPQEAENLVAAALKSMVTGKAVTTPHLAVKFVNVNYKYTIGIGAAQLAQGLGVSASKSITSVHKGFAVIWKGSGDSLSSLTNSLNLFSGAALSGKSDFAALIGRLANRTDLKGLGKLADAIFKTDSSALADQFVVSKLSSTLGISKAELQQLYQPGNPIIDLRATQLDERLTTLLGRLAAGNEGSLKVTKLEFNLNSYEFNAVIAIRHRHSWGSVNDILAAVGKRVGQWVDKAGNVVNQKIDAAGNTIRDIAYQVGDRVTDIFNKAGTLLQRVSIDTAGQKIATYYTSGVATLQRTWNRAGDLTEKWEKTATGTMRSYYTKGALSVQKLWNSAGDLAERWEKTATGTMRSYYTNGVTTVQKIWNSAGTITERWEKTATGTMRTYYTSGVATMEKLWNSSGDMTEKWQKTATGTMRSYYTNGVVTVQKLWNSAGNLTEKWEKTATGAMRSYYTKGVVTVQRLWNSAGSLAEKWEKTATGTMRTYFKNGAAVRQKIWDSGGDLVQTWEKTATGTIKTFYKNGVATAQNVYDTAGNLLRKATGGSGIKLPGWLGG